MANEASSVFSKRWKARMSQLIKLQYGREYDLDKDKVNKYLDSILAKNIKNPKIALVNNYTNVIAKTDVLSTIDLIENNQLIIGGGGCIYAQQSEKDSPLSAYIIYNLEKRSILKKERGLYEKGSDEWLDKEIAQGNTKRKVNSLYGSLGYARFHFHNRFNAEATTSMGRNIICSAAEGFEGFLSDNLNFSTEEELFEYIGRIHGEYKEKYKGKLDVSIFPAMFRCYIADRVYDRLLAKCIFEYPPEFTQSLHDMILGRTEDELVLLCFKNNFFEFSKTPFIQDKIEYIVRNVSADEIWKLSKSSDVKIKQLIEELWDFYKVFVLYDYPIFDRVRKGMYNDKKAVIYIDTDSNFLALNNFVTYVKSDILRAHYPRDEHEVEHAASSVILNILERVVARSMQTMCEYMNIVPDVAKRLQMKNEFFLTRMLFTDSKKRYISNALFQEGYLLGKGEGVAEIKGFDFKKASVKPFVTEYFTKLCLDDILRADKIDVQAIYKKMLFLRRDIEDSMRRGESKYYKQATVQNVQNYKRPYSLPGYTGVLLWNTLNPAYALELPADVDVIPIKSLSFKESRKTSDEDKRLKKEAIARGEKAPRAKMKEHFDIDEIKNKNTRDFAEKFPEEFERLRREIFGNANPDIRHMSLNYIAKPKNEDISLPPWFAYLIDTDKIVNDTLGLFYPILDTLGLNLLKTNSSTQHLSNMIAL